ncbi:MAG: heptaprenylglyceryl phosphate synthase [Candidatus Bathyarchaeia archaeon]|nr:heptaprenylglyceryl phosphate synthase [Candidatus Bathyarchaeota archaeon]
MNLDFSSWKHVTKLDPDKENTKEVIQTVIESGTDAIMVSGTQRITKRKVVKLINMLKGCGKPIVLEPVKAEAVVFNNVDYIFVPSVINSRDKWWIIEAHVNWILKIKKKNIPWEKIVPEAYIVLNPKSAVAKVTKAVTNLSLNQIVSYAIFADRFVNFPILYIEYSGVYGDPKVVKTVKEELKQAKLFYGGGINNKERAEKMAKYATIVVGNIVYEDLNKFKETII